MGGLWIFFSSMSYGGIVPSKELVITDLSVVENGRAQPGIQNPWSFSFLMKQLAPSQQNPSVFVESWLSQWLENRTVNGFPVPARPKMQEVIQKWPKNNSGHVDLEKAPFRLLAILYRPDLVDSSKKKAGELRFVFCLLDETGRSLPFTVIFEYMLPIYPEKGFTVQEWAKRWHKLGSMNFGEEYLGELQKITDTIITAKSNQNFPLFFLTARTNENTLNVTWELREFRLAANGKLMIAPTLQNPDNTFMTTASIRGPREPELLQWIRDHQDEILANNFRVPNEFLSGAVSSPARWARSLEDPKHGPKLNQARHLFALETCNGCHTFETNTGFTHIKPRAAGEEAALSKFIITDTKQRAKVMEAMLGFTEKRSWWRRRTH